MISAGVGGWIACGVSVIGVWVWGVPRGADNNSVNMLAATKKWFQVLCIVWIPDATK
jgi:hypothetical protein